MKPRLFCEFPAGLAAVSLRLHGGEHCRPPISRMGNKAGYSAVILAALGLRSGAGAGAYWWAEADADVAALLRAYPDAALLRRIAEIIRGWADEEPRALWERLRAERKARGGPSASALGPAEWIVSMGWGNGGTPGAGMGWNGGYSGPGNARGNERYPDIDTLSDRCHRLAQYAMITASNRLINVADDGTGDLRNTGQGGTTFGGAEFATPAAEVAERFEGMAREVAGWTVTGAWAMRRGVPDSGYTESRTGHGIGAGHGDTADMIAGKFGRVNSGWPPVRVTRQIPTAAEVAEALGTPGDLERVVVYMDPPYQGTTGYAADLSRAEVVAHALDFDALGAVVCVSEAEALPELVGRGWRVAEVTEGRRGQKRTFSAQKREFLTMNREPAHRVAVQAGLFGGA